MFGCMPGPGCGIAFGTRTKAILTVALLAGGDVSLAHCISWRVAGGEDGPIALAKTDTRLPLPS
jgi:hypothetical protein